MSVLIVAMALFSIGLYGVLTRRDIVALFACIEVMIGGALVLLVGLAAGSAEGAQIQAVGLLVLVAAAAEAAVGLALLVALARRRGTTRTDDLTEVKG